MSTFFSLATFAASGLTLIRQLALPLLPLSFTLSLITVILCTINSLSLHYQPLAVAVPLRPLYFD